MIKRYTLVKNDENRMPVGRIEYDTDTHKLDCYEYNSWADGGDGKYNIPIDESFVASVYGKPDSCTHWNFYGEDYDPVYTEADSYYHICGSYYLKNMMLYMAFIWSVLEREHRNKFSKNYYTDDKTLNAVIKTLMTDYEIVLEEVKDDKT